MPKRIAPLSELDIKNAKPAAKDYTLFDGGGLMLKVTTSGSKLWRFKYRFDGGEKRMAMGIYPDVSLKDARQKRDEARKLVASGLDPALERKQQKIIVTQEAETFSLIAREWLDHQEGRLSDGHAKRVWRALEKDALPVIGNAPIGSITTPTLVTVVRSIEARGAGETASRVLQWISAIFRYCLHTGRLTYNPAADMRGALKARVVTHRAMLNLDELPEFYRRLDSYGGEPLTSLAIELLILTLSRTGEVRGAQWDEFDLDQRLWRVPGERMKMKAPHIVPLSDQSLSILDQIKNITGGQGLLFPGRVDRNKPFSENTLLFAMYRMGYHGQACVHGFRALASTVLNEQGFDADVIERSLAHVEQNKVRKAYHRAEYLDGRREMLQWWGNFLDEMKMPTNEVPVRAAVG